MAINVFDINLRSEFLIEKGETIKLFYSYVFFN